MRWPRRNSLKRTCFGGGTIETTAAPAPSKGHNERDLLSVFPKFAAVVAVQKDAQRGEAVPQAHRSGRHSGIYRSGRSAAAAAAGQGRLPARREQEHEAKYPGGESREEVTT